MPGNQWPRHQANPWASRQGWEQELLGHLPQPLGPCSLSSCSFVQRRCQPSGAYPIRWGRRLRHWVLKHFIMVFFKHTVKLKEFHSEKTTLYITTTLILAFILSYMCFVTYLYIPFPSFNPFYLLDAFQSTLQVTSPQIFQHAYQ